MLQCIKFRRAVEQRLWRRCVIRNYAIKRPFLRSSSTKSASNLNSNKSAPALSGEPRKFEVVLDNETLYIPKELASALGWKPDAGTQPGTGISLSLHGWEPAFFAIAPTGSDSGRITNISNNFRYESTDILMMITVQNC